MEGDYFWVLMLVLYFVFQVLGGRKKKKQKAQRRRAERAAEPSSEMPSRDRRQRPAPEEVPARSPELDEALQEIRRALGFPAESAPRPKPEPRVEGRHVGDGGPTQAPAEEASGERHPLPSMAPPPAEAGERTTIRKQQPRSIPEPRQVLKPPRTPSRSASLTYSRHVEAARPDRLRSRPKKEIAVRVERIDGEASPNAREQARARSERVDAIRSILQGGQSLRDALLVKEILDPPRSMRPIR